MTTDWILRVGNGKNLIRSSRFNTWGINSTTRSGKHFTTNVQVGDRLWFVKSKSNGLLIAVATYRSHNKRELGPLINTTLTNEELGWDNEDTDWTSDIEVHYTDLYNLTYCELLSHVKGAATIRKYDEKCRVNLPVEYSYIVRYSRVLFEM
jgi:hypothetical protein